MSISSWPFPLSDNVIMESQPFEPANGNAVRRDD
jgi:hypothetical protein